MNSVLVIHEMTVKYIGLRLQTQAFILDFLFGWQYYLRNES